MSATENIPSLESSSRVSDFLLDRSQSRRPGVIGYGAFSMVFLANNATGPGQFVVKRFLYGQLTKSQFEREISALPKLNHPCVLRFLGYRLPEDDQCAEIYMEYASNGSLASVLTKAASKPAPSFWNATGIAIIICGIVLGMRFIHSRGFIHYDLKPSNILLNGQGRTLIADFGTARDSSFDCTLSNDPGTVPYSAPEMFDGSSPTSKADVFSFGIILYEILVGERFYGCDGSLHQILGKLANRSLPAIPSSVLPSMRKLISNCLQFDSNLRPSFDDILTLLTRNDFEILAGPDRSRIREYVQGICSTESIPPSSDLRRFDVPSDLSSYVIASRPSHHETVIGRGSFSTVLLAERANRTEVFAIKRISFDRFNASQFMREVESLVKLNHPCIVRILGFAWPISRPAEIHMEYAKGGSLDHVLNVVGSRLVPPFWNVTGISVIICGIVLGMQFVHSCGASHLNLKPSNILLSDQGRTLISDFGMARAACDGQTRSGFKGSVGYAAPELFDDVDATPKVDVFSFGSILYEILVGSPAFSPNLPSRTIVGKLKNHEMPNIPDSISPPMNTLISKCWAVNPGDRPSFNEILETFERMDFNLVFGADRSLVRRYVREVREWESINRAHRR
jgi:serine/threonine protein kinase